MRLVQSFLSAGCVLNLLWYCGTSHAADLTTTTTQGSGADWTAAIWKTNGLGTAVAPTAGNTYQCVANATAFGNTANNTRIRNPATAGVQTFPGDSLTLNTNTELRMKTAGAILNFPGVGGNPGLILNGGILNVGDTTVFTVTGKAQVTSQSYLCPGDNGGAGVIAGRAVILACQLSGSGDLVIFEATTNAAQEISGNSNTFSGQWIVKAGWLLGSGANSLGTNNIIMDPSFILPVPPFSDTAPVVEVAGPSVFEVGYDINSAGTLTLINGGTMRLHQNCAFNAVNIEGTMLSLGMHTYSELVANFPNSFEAGGSGTMTVQPYGAPPVVRPTISTQPLPQMLYAGRTARFTVAAGGTAPLNYQWRKGGVNLTDGGNLSGATNVSLVVSNVSTADAGAYDVVVSNLGGGVTSTGVTLTLVTPSGEAYENAIIAANPVAFYRLNETSDPAVNASVFDYAGGYVGTYGATVQNGNPNYNIAGPLPSEGFPGFAAGNKAALFNGTGTARVTVAPWNLNTNTVTLTAWINPNGAQSGTFGIVFCRGGGTVAGLDYTSNTDASGNYTLGYTWNNEWETWSWNSGLVAPPGQWSLVALVVTPTNATIQVMNTNGLIASSHAWNHGVQAFGGTTLIGDDSADGGNGTRVFSGTIDDVAVFNTALSATQIAALYSAASGVASFAPAIGLQPASLNLYAGQTAQFTVGAGGTGPLSYQWQKGSGGGYANVTDGGRISGSTTPALTINNVVAGDAVDYLVTVTSPKGSLISSAATLTVMPTSPAEKITMSIQQVANMDWNNAGDWSDGMAASDSAAAKPGSTYELLAGSRLRTPLNPSITNFPGNVLTLSGDGVWVNNPAATNTTISEIRFKQPNPGQVIFKKLVMNGGQLDAGNDNVIVIGGEIDIVANAPIYSDSGNDRGLKIDAWLTGTGTIEYHGYNQSSFMPAYVNNLNIAGSSNTFSGTWNVVLGTLLGTAPNALGTNEITIGTNGALETTYDINNPNGSLLLNGRMYLHQNDTFRNVLIRGVAIPPGTYAFSQLSTTYSNNFPVSWTPQTGATNFSTGSGSLTVLGFTPPTIVVQPLSQTLYVGQTGQFTVSALGGQPLSYQWRVGANGIYTSLSDGGRISGSTTTNLTISNLVPGDSADYVLVITNSASSVTSIVARLTVQPTGPPMNITLSAQQPTGSDWDTAADWSDGLAASVSAMAKPGSTYEVLPGARLRSPANTPNAVFPGNVLTMDGDGVYLNNPPAGSTLGEFRFKQPNSGDSVTFKKLVMNGGQLDTGNDGLVVIRGEMNIATNTPVGNNSSSDRGYQIDAWLTGSGPIEYHGYQAAFNAAYVNSLNISGPSNTFSGQWNVAVGILLGSAPNALGTNDITVGLDGALETTYGINNPYGMLTLDGQMFLHQNDVFGKVTIGGVELAEGTYTFAQLSAAYPNNFSATWPAHAGAEAFTTGSGSLTVRGSAPPPVAMQIQFSGSNLRITWPQGTLQEADNVIGPWATNNASSPFTNTPVDPKKFYRIRVR